jgi:hypothetical protein
MILRAQCDVRCVILTRSMRRAVPWHGARRETRYFWWLESNEILVFFVALRSSEGIMHTAGATKTKKTLTLHTNRVNVNGCFDPPSFGTNTSPPAMQCPHTSIPRTSNRVRLSAAAVRPEYAFCHAPPNTPLPNDFQANRDAVKQAQVRRSSGEGVEGWEICWRT